MNQELTDFLASIGYGVVGGLLLGTPAVIYRYLKGERIFPKQKKPTPKWVWPVGIFTFGGFSVIAYSIKLPYFGTFFAFILALYIVGFIRSKKKQAKCACIGLPSCNPTSDSPKR